MLRLLRRFLISFLGRETLDRQRQELEGRAAIASIIARGGALVSTAEETLDVVRRMARIDVGILYRVDGDSGDLVLVAQRGLDDELAAFARVRPLDGTHVGEAARSGRVQVTGVDTAPLPDGRMRDIAERRAHRTQLALPIPVGDRTWGVLALISGEVRDFSAEEIVGLEAVAPQVGLAVERAELQETAAARLNRLEAQREIERHISEHLDLEDLLVLVAGSARRLIGGAFSIVYLREGDELCARAWTGQADWIRDLRIPVGVGVTGTAVATGRGLIVNDYPSSPLAVPPFNSAALRLLVQPLLAGGRALGAMVISRQDDGAPFTPDDLTTLADFATQAAVAIENARLFAEAKRSAAEYQALFEVAGLVGSTLDVERLLDLMVDRCRALMGVAAAGIFKLDTDAGTFTYERGVGLSPEFVSALRLRLGEGTTGRAGRDRTPAWTADILADAAITLAPETRDLVLREGYRAVLSVPILIKGEPYGVLAVYWWEPHLPSPAEIALMSALAGQAAIALENARLYGAATARGKRLVTLARLTETLTATLAPEDVLSRVVHSAVELFGSSVSGLWLMSEDGGSLVLRAHAGTRALVPLMGIMRLDLGEGLMGRIVAGRETLVVPDLCSDPRVKNVEDVRAEGVVSFAGVPLILGDRVLGALSVALRDARRFSEEDLSLLHSLGNHAAIAIENARLLRQTQQKLEETERLLGVSRTLASTLDLETLPRQFLRHVVGALAAETAGMWLLDEGGEWMEALAGYHVPPERREALGKLRLSIVQDPFYAEAARTRRPVVSPDVMHDARIPQQFRDALPHRTQLFVPIIAKDRILGGFGVTWGEAPRELSQSELRLVEAIASQAGVALENARLFRDNQRRVEELSVLNELSRAVTGQLDQAELLDTIEQQVARLLDVRHLVILLHDESSASLEVIRRVKDGARQHGGRHQYSPGAAGLSGVVFDTGRPISTRDYIAECARRHVDPVPESLDLPHWLGVPMAAGNRPLGVLALRSRDRAFTDGDQRLLASIADLAALALRSARLYEERTRAHRELSAAQDQLVRTEKLRALGEMASGVAHDFNNVLAGILGRAQLLLGKVEDPKLRRWIEVIERSALDGARTVRRLQDFTRIRRDHPVVPVDLNQVVQQSLEATESSWHQESQRRGIQIEVTTSLARPLPKVPGDPAELREALTNLILNALDAMPGGGTLALATAACNGQVEIAVTDTGIGIPAGIRDKIFDPFFTTKGPKGTGLGLSMTYGIVARHGARITVEGEEGHGTTFRLIFPAAAETGEPADPPETPPASAPSLRCLVVDDEEAVAEVLGDMLVAEGHRVEVVGCGQEAIARFSAGAFDLVLTDLAMPGMSGWDVARAIKDMAPAARVVLVSGFGVEVSPEDLRAHGVDLVLAKPLRLQDIGSMVTMARATRGTWPPPSGQVVTPSTASVHEGDGANG